MNRIEKQILQLLLTGKHSVYKLIYFQDADLPKFFKTLNDLEEKKLIEIKSGKVSLTRQGLSYAEKSKLIPSTGMQCRECNSSGIKLNSFFKKTLKKYSEIAENRPNAIPEFDQGFINPIGVIQRIAFMHERVDLAGNSFFVAGDDDLLSIALALTDLPEKIVMIDADKRLTDFVNSTAKSFDLNIKAELYDVRKPLRKELRKSFDVFVTDPVETLPGIKLFLSRCCSALKGKNSAGYFGLTTLEASAEKWREIELMLLKMGFAVTDIKRKFNIYPDDEKSYSSFQETYKIFKKLKTKPDCNWYNSSFLRVQAVQSLKPLIKGNTKLHKAFYSDQESWASPY